MVDLVEWAYPEDIPGARCTPEDGPWPRAYYLLDEAEIWDEFQRLADPSSIVFSPEKGWRADAVNFQPSLAAITQDRYVLRQLSVHGRLWSLTGVFDGGWSSFFAHNAPYQTHHLISVVNTDLISSFQVIWVTRPSSMSHTTSR